MSRWCVFNDLGGLGVVEIVDNADGTAAEQAEMLAEARWPNARNIRVQHEDWEPDDFQIMNGPGVEGGISYANNPDYQEGQR